MSSAEWKKQRFDEYNGAHCQDGGECAHLVGDDKDDDHVTMVKSSKSSGPCVSALRTAAWLLGGIVLCFMIVIMYFQIVYRSHGLDGRKSWLAFRGVDDVTLEQELTVSPSGDYVVYHVKQPNEESWIFDNYDQGYRLMKITSTFEQVCYVTPLNSTRSELDIARSLDQQNIAINSEDVVNRKKRQTTFFVDETREMVLSNLGATALELCVGVPSYWVYPTTAYARNHGEFARTHGRDKRNVKKCVVSCCEMVCCCNQKWLQWQSTSMFNCHNVCHGCTSRSNMDVTELC